MTICIIIEKLWVLQQAMVLKPCGHSSSEVDPHPYCDECALIKKVNSKERLCAPPLLCKHCRDTKAVVWKLIEQYRTNKTRRRKLTLKRRSDAIKEVCSSANISHNKAIPAVTAVTNPSEVVTEDTSTVEYTPETEEADNRCLEFLKTTPTGSDFSFPDMGDKKKKGTAAPTPAAKKAALAKKHEALLAQMQKELAEAEGPADIPVHSKTRTSSRASSTASNITKPKRRSNLSPIPKDKRQKRSRSRQRTPTKRSSNVKRNRSDSDRRDKRDSREKRSVSNRRQAAKRRSLSRSVSRHRQDKYARCTSHSRSRSRKRVTSRDRRSHSSQRSHRSYTGIVSQRRKAEEKVERRDQNDSYRSERHRSRSLRVLDVDRRSYSQDRRHGRHGPAL